MEMRSVCMLFWAVYILGNGRGVANEIGATSSDQAGDGAVGKNEVNYFRSKFPEVQKRSSIKDLREVEMSETKQELVDELEMHPLLKNVLRPDHNVIRTDHYRTFIAQPADPISNEHLNDDARANLPSFLSYGVELLLNPCLGHNYDCCSDTFGSPEYVRDSGDGEIYTVETHARICGGQGKLLCGAKREEKCNNAPEGCAFNVETDQCEKLVAAEHSRIGHASYHYDEGCVEKGKRRQHGSLINDDRCIGTFSAVDPAEIEASCTDNNSTVISCCSCRRMVAGCVGAPCSDIKECRSKFGYCGRGGEYCNSESTWKYYGCGKIVTQNCVQVGFSQTAYIAAECGGAYKDDPNCGTFLEVHHPGNDETLSEVRLPKEAVFTSGFRAVELPMTYKNESDKVLCLGNYELWWVQRTRIGKIVEYKKKFRITVPSCEYEHTKNQYLPYSNKCGDDLCRHQLK